MDNRQHWSKTVEKFNTLSYRQKMFVWATGTLILAASVGGIIFEILGPRQLGSFMPRGTVLAELASVTVIAISAFYGDRIVGKPPVKPVIKTWFFEGCDIVAAEVDYDLADQVRYRMALALGTDPQEYAPIPTVIACFTESKPTGRIRTGTKEDYKKLVAQCRVQRVRIYVPKILGKTLVVPLREFYRLVFGSKEAGDAAYARAYPTGR